MEEKRFVRCIVGIDPGLAGAIAFFFPDAPDRITVEDMPTLSKTVDGWALAARIDQMRPTGALVEKVGGMPGQGITSTFNFGHAVGTVHGVLAAYHVPFLTISPARWKRHFGLSKDKELSRALAVRLWPSCDQFRRKKDHGRAEAALLARYGAELLIQPGTLASGGGG